SPSSPRSASRRSACTRRPGRRRRPAPEAVRPGAGQLAPGGAREGSRWRRRWTRFEGKGVSRSRWRACPTTGSSACASPAASRGRFRSRSSGCRTTVGVPCSTPTWPLARRAERVEEPRSAMTDPAASRRDERLALARVLVELGELAEAEVVVADLLDAQPDDLEALSLLAKVKHMAGQLSQAVACWAQLHARSPMNETALMHLGALLHLAQDPERGAGEFLALGQLQLMKRPAAHLELEEAFRLLLARRPDEARARCDRLAVLHRRSDPALFKLATLAGAWIAELAGDPEA